MYLIYGQYITRPEQPKEGKGDYKPDETIINQIVNGSINF